MAVDGFVKKRKVGFLSLPDTGGYQRSPSPLFGRSGSELGTDPNKGSVSVQKKPVVRQPTAMPISTVPQEPLIEGEARRKKYGKRSLLATAFLSSDNGGLKETYGS